MITHEAEPRNRNQEVSKSLVSDILACSELYDEPNDVLGANLAFRSLPAMISAQDSSALIGNTELLAVKAAQITWENSSLEDMAIAQRDLGMFVTAATLVSHKTRGDQGVPVAEDYVPEGAKELVRLSEILDRPARSEDGNWSGMNGRFFTDTTIMMEGKSVRAEAIVKITVGENWKLAEKTSKGLVELSGTTINDSKFPTLMAESIKDLTPLLSAIAVTKTNLTNKDEGMEFFMKEIFTMTEPFIIDGKKVSHSGSQYFPMHLNDAILGITDPEDTKEQAYLDQALKGASENQRAQLKAALENVQKFGTLSQQVFAHPKAIEGIKGVYQMLKMISAFRKAHKGVILKSEKFRTDGQSSGGHKSIAIELEAKTVMLRNLVGEYVKD